MTGTSYIYTLSPGNVIVKLNYSFKRHFQILNQTKQNNRNKRQKRLLICDM